MRQLQTIGDLGTVYRSGPLGRQAIRRAARSIGQTNADFTVPTGQPPGEGTDVYDAAIALLNQFDTYGATSMHVADPVVSAFQAQYNAWASSVGAMPLSVDGGYGPNTYTAADWILGGVAPAVNTGATPGPSPAIQPAPPAPEPAPPHVTPATPATPTAPAQAHSSLAFWLIAAAAAGGVYYFFFHKKKRKSGGAHRSRTTSIEVRGNPKRRAARRR